MSARKTDVRNFPERLQDIEEILEDVVILKDLEMLASAQDLITLEYRLLRRLDELKALIIAGGK